MVLLLKKVIIIKSNCFHWLSIKLLTPPECSQACRLEVPGQHVFILEHGVMLFKHGHVGTIDRKQGQHRNHGGKSQGWWTNALTRAMRWRAPSQKMFSGQVFVPGGTAGVGAADPHRRLPDWRQKAAKGVGAERWTGVGKQHCTDATLIGWFGFYFHDLFTL